MSLLKTHVEKLYKKYFNKYRNSYGYKHKDIDKKIEISLNDFYLITNINYIIFSKKDIDTLNYEGECICSHYPHTICVPNG